MITWKGPAPVILTLSGVPLGLAFVTVKSFHIEMPYAASVYSVGVLLGSAMIWYLARRIESRPGRVVVDKATGRKVTVRPSAGSVLYIPIRYWAFIVPAMVLAMFVAEQLEHQR